MADETKPLEEILSEGRDGSTPRDEKGRFAPAEPKGEARPEQKPTQQEQQPPAEPVQEQPQDDPDSDPKNWTYAAYKDEKVKRQSAEQRIAEAEQRAKQVERELMQHRAQLAQQQQQPPQQPIDPFSDPEGYAQQQQSALQSTLQNIRLENNLQLAEMKHGETFSQAWDAFLEASYAGDKATYFRVMNSPNPGEAMVQWHRERETFSQIGPDPAKWQEEQRAKIREEILAEMNGTPLATQQSSQQPQVQMPSDLAGARNVGSRSGPAWSGPAPIGDIFKRNPKRAQG